MNEIQEIAFKIKTRKQTIQELKFQYKNEDYHIADLMADEFVKNRVLTEDERETIVRYLKRPIN